MRHENSRFCTGLLLALGMAVVSGTSASAFELGGTGRSQPPGLVLGNGAASPPPGLYMFDQVLTYQSKAVGPGADFIKKNINNGRDLSVNAVLGAAGLFWVPGWSFLGATYDAVIAQPFIMGDFGSPFNFSNAGAHNTFIAPIELSWKLGDTGFFVKSGLGLWVPTRAQTGTGFPWRCCRDSRASRRQYRAKRSGKWVRKLGKPLLDHSAVACGFIHQGRLESDRQLIPRN